jgi:hypothetical protein
MSSIPQVSKAIQQVLSERATALERSTGFVQRESAQVRGATFVQSLVFGFLANPQASYGMWLRAWAWQSADKPSSNVWEKARWPCSERS